MKLGSSAGEAAAGGALADDSAALSAGAGHAQTPRLNDVQEPPRVCGLVLRFGPRVQFALLSAGALSSAMAFAALQEGVFKIDGFRYGGWMTFVTSAWFCVCSGLELLVSGDTQRRGSWRDYCTLAALTTSGMYLTNWALNYLNYSTRIVFKSSKVVPTMILGTVLQGRRYDMQEYAAAALLVAGVSLFCLGDVAVAPNFHIAGVGLITLALFADAATSNFEEKRFFRIAAPVSQAEVIFYSSALSSLAGFAVLLPTRELGPAWEHSRANGVVVPLLSAAAVCGYLSVTFVLLLIKYYGATNTEIVKSLRKVLSIALSFAIYPKPVNSRYLGGMAATCASLVISYRLKRRKAAVVMPAPAPAAVAQC